MTKPNEPKYEFSCTNCGEKVEYSRKMAGTRSNCPKCRSAITIPYPEEKRESIARSSEPDQERPTKCCPFCGEIILEAAVKCRYCLSILNDKTDDALGTGKRRKKLSTRRSAQKEERSPRGNRLVTMAVFFCIVGFVYYEIFDADLTPAPIAPQAPSQVVEPEETRTEVREVHITKALPSSKSTPQPEAPNGPHVEREVGDAGLSEQAPRMNRSLDSNRRMSKVVTRSTSDTSHHERMLSMLSELNGKDDISNISAVFQYRKKISSDRVRELTESFVAILLLKNDREDIYKKKIAPVIKTKSIIEEYGKKRCETCKGTGKSGYACFKCKGRGKCTNGRCNRGFVHSNIVRNKMCPICNGTGKCTKCHGRGLLYKKHKKCNGSGRVWSSDKINDAYAYLLSALKDEVRIPLMMRSIVVIKGDRGVGTGFICKVFNRIFVVSNAHVLVGNNKVSLMTTDGNTVNFDKVYLATSRDIALYEVSNSQSLIPLPMMDATDLDIGSRVVVYGNSLGGGAVTVLNGKILGIGPEVIEADAPFVKGNSGSPLVVDGKVCGIATLLVRQRADWTIAQTRFTKTRRFAVRFDNMNFDHFELLDATHYLEDMVELNAANGAVTSTVNRIIQSRLRHVPSSKKIEELSNLKSRLEGRKWSATRIRKRAEDLSYQIGIIERYVKMSQ